MTDLVIKAPDDFSDNHIEGRMFTGSMNSSVTAHVWLNEHTRGNVIKLDSDETVIDEEEENTLEHEEKRE